MMSSPASTHLLPSATAASLLPRRVSPRLCFAGAGPAARRRGGSRLAVFFFAARARRPPLLNERSVLPSARTRVLKETIGGSYPPELLAVVRASSAEAALPAYTSDSLILYFKAEGTMEERAIPKITESLEGMEGVKDLEVLIEEGIASVVLTKETTVQATGVASNLVEAIQGAGFKLQTLSLSFDDFDETSVGTAGTGAQPSE